MASFAVILAQQQMLCYHSTWISRHGKLHVEGLQPLFQLLAIAQA